MHIKERIETIDQIKHKKNDILTFLPELKTVRIGVAGSFARGENTKDSDIDLVFDTDKLTFQDIEKIKNLFPLVQVDVLQLPLLKEQDEKDDLFLEKIGFAPNEDSVYKNIMREVLWL